MDRESENFDKIKKENEIILGRFSNDGVDLNVECEFEFVVELPSKEACQAVRANYRNRFEKLKNGFFMVVTEKGRFTLRIFVDFIPSAELITRIETNLFNAAEDFSGVNVIWEFKHK